MIHPIPKTKNKLTQAHITFNTHTQAATVKFLHQS